MEDYAACADLCERRGFAAPADRLRAVAGGRARAYVVVEWHRGDYGLASYEGGTPRAAFADRGAAERDAGGRNLRFLRGCDDIADLLRRSARRPVGDLAAAIGLIFGRGLEFPAPGPIFAFASDEQLRAVAGLAREGFFGVVEVELEA